MSFPRNCFGLSVPLALVILATMASATPVINWSLDGSLNNSTSLIDALTNSPTLGDGTADNAENSAIWATIPDTVIPDGQGIRLSGEVTIAGAVPDQIKFRWGLFRELGASPPDPTSGWLGYSLGNSNGSDVGIAIERVPGAADFNSTSFTSLSPAHGDTIGNSFDDGADLFEDGTYQFEMTVARKESRIDLFGSLDGGSFSNSWGIPDFSPATDLDSTFNRVGLVAGSGFRADQLRFRNLDVSPVLNPPKLGCVLTKSCVLNKVADNGEGVTMPYQLVTPPGHDQPGEKFPLIIYLHGAEVGDVLNGLVGVSQTEEFPAFVLGPKLFYGRWGPNNNQDLMLDILDDVIEQYAIDERRIYITGLSMGGFGTTTYVQNDPSQFAAAVPMSGANTISPAQAEQIKDVPFWLFHGGDDTVVDPVFSRNFVAALEQAGSAPRYDELPRQGHNIWHPIYADWQTDTYGLYPWLFSQSLPVPEPGGMPLTLLAAALIGPVLRKREAVS